MHLPVQVGFGDGPLALQGGRRNLQDFRRLVNRQAPKETQFDQAALLRISLLEAGQCVVERQQVYILLLGNSQPLIELQLERTSPAFP